MPRLQGVVIRQKKAWRRREGVFVYFEALLRRRRVTVL